MTEFYPEPDMLPVCPDIRGLPLDELSPGVMGYSALKYYQHKKEADNYRPSTVVARATSGGDFEFEAIKREPAIKPDVGMDAGILVTKNRIAQMSPTFKTRFNRWMTHMMAEGFDDPEKRQQAKKDNRNVDWAEYLANGATREESLQIYGISAARLLGKQSDPQFQQAVRGAAQGFIHAVKPELQAGRFHPEAEGSLDKVKNAEFRLGDFLDMQAQGRSGYAYHGKPKIFIREYINPNNMVDIPTAWHEFGHAVFGRFDDLLWDEGWTEHNALSLTHGGWDIINPNLRNVEGAYPNCRQVVDFFCGDDDTIPWTRAYSAVTAEAKQEAIARAESQLEPRQLIAMHRVRSLMEEVRRAALARKDSPFTAVEAAAGDIIVHKTPTEILLQFRRNAKEYKAFRKSLAANLTGKH